MILGRVVIIFSILAYTGSCLPFQDSTMSKTNDDITPATYPLRAEYPLKPLEPTTMKNDDDTNDDDPPPSTTDNENENDDTISHPSPTTTTTNDQPNIRPGLLTTCQAEHQFALTFDDGPFEYTSALIDLLIKEGIKATFFINGNNYWSGEKINPDLKKAYNEGSEIASHTFTHPKLSTLSNDQIKKEMAQNEKAIFGAIGQYPAVMRPPYGDVTDDNVKYLNSLNYTVVTWSIDIKDWDKKPSVEQEMKAVQDALKESPNNNIILQHDVYKQTATVFAPKVIEFVKSQNLQFVTMSECLQVDAYKKIPISD